MDVDQAAALVLCSVGWARRHGIPCSKWVFLHGCGDAYELPPLMRARLDRSPAMGEAYRQARAMAKAASRLDSLEDVKHFDVQVFLIF
jgi:acetyl-CoA C-acetyltransferase